MAPKFSLIIILFVLALADSTIVSDTHFGDSLFNVGEWIDQDEETTKNSNTVRRSLAQTGGHISYGALERDFVPCTNRGASYYNCQSASLANPYSRGCTKITHCQRNLG
ncbi:hypothetical protein IFM89_009788 [Coptis chinensis]|uniref:Uncharacterized protein n=1 Tax=Coptis chinensis TaxID=261450 RepID=A0A835LXA3_9MAGN|nr:hypothetical protein IFM89_009788 [Coptis chinensis]